MPSSTPADDASGGRRILLFAIALLVLSGAGALIFFTLRFPSDRTPEGAYYRIVIAVNDARPKAFFAYTETAAQHACYTIRDYRKRARERVLASYPEPERTRLAKAYEPEALAPDGADIFALYAERLGWQNRLRQDLSGVAKSEIMGDRATIQTARGTRYPFRRRENGIWGITIFTARLNAEAEKAARDAELIEKAAADYDRARSKERP